MTAKLISYTRDYMPVLLLAASQSYQKMASDKVIKHIIQAGHWIVLEHCMATFECTASISVLLQITRHRHLSFTVQSSRGSELTSYRHTGNKIIDADNDVAMHQYRALLNGGEPYEEAAYLLPKAAEYSFIMSGNLRAWMEYLPKRLCKRAMPEHRELAQEIAQELRYAMPEIFDRDLMACSTCRETSCGFKNK